MDTELAEMKARAVALLDLLEDIHRSEVPLWPDHYQRATDFLNNSQWVDE